MKNINEVLSCTGCRMCGDICPKKLISFRENHDGFVYPVVDENACMGCGLCVAKCPTNHVSLNPKQQNVMSAIAKDSGIKSYGSSGGIFGLLARYVLSEGGLVWGAAFDENLQLHHVCASKLDELKPLCKSKYLQSDCSKVYSSVEKDLKEGKTILFCGTPCQCQALKNFVGDKSDNLILVDFVCHGVPSQRLFNDNLVWNEKKYGKVIGVEFRYKGEGVKHPQTLKLDYDEHGKKKSVLRLHYQDPFYFGFQKHITMRPSCYQCHWAKPERSSDITLADFWSVEKLHLGLDSKKGVSCVLLNTSKAENIWNLIRDRLEGVNEIPIDFAVKHNGCLGSPTEEPIGRKQFFEDWRALGYERVVSKYLVPRRKWVFDLYYAIPSPIKKIVRKLMDKKMKYE